MRFTIYQESRIGQRRTNQDRIAYCYSRDALLMLVADGMGGHLHGEIAAQVAAKVITQSFQRDATPALREPALFLSRALVSAHHAILDFSFDRNLPESPRTTIVACVVQDGVAWWAHAGDSRLYLLRQGHIHMQTRDHSRVQLMMEQGLLDARDAASHPGRNRIYSCLGGTQPPQIDFSRGTPLCNGDVVALCSDGLWAPLGDDGLLLGLAGRSVMQGVPQLLDRAEINAGATADNLSLIAMCWQDESAPPGVDTISTRTMALDEYTTRIDVFERARPPAPVGTTVPGALGAAADLTDEEIERAIAEINAAINKFDKQE
ncbi:PP2C family protein-serine/threonine phosphatase [Thauera sinica]|uniref:PP2C family protein-serine/threonine phosphatase n=1 Tax=Thauera sinica TaxID=2665146 RepID=A0ABW1AXK0_9RHOO|nr:protein phosphatase 2C domain-containing protein [Thauera sp. K11]ATE61898.1 phosphatase [Thauera sp. K11]